MKTLFALSFLALNVAVASHAYALICPLLRSNCLVCNVTVGCKCFGGWCTYAWGAGAASKGPLRVEGQDSSASSECLKVPMRLPDAIEKAS